MLSFCSQPEPCEQPTVTLFIVFWMKNASSSESVTSGEIIEIESSTAEFSLFCGVHVLRECSLFLLDWLFLFSFFGIQCTLRESLPIARPA